MHFWARRGLRGRFWSLRGWIWEPPGSILEPPGLILEPPGSILGAFSRLRTSKIMILGMQGEREREREERDKREKNILVPGVFVLRAQFFASGSQAGFLIFL